MNEIVFDTDFLNKYFKTKTNMDKIYIENIRRIPYIALKGRGKKITQHDLDILLTNFEELSLIDIDLDGLNFDDNTKKNLKRLKLLGKKDYDFNKIIKDYPNYNELSLQDRYRIISDEKYAVYPNLKASGVSNLNSVIFLLINGYNVSEDTKNEFYRMKKLRKLIINGNVEKDSEINNTSAENNKDIEKKDEENKIDNNRIEKQENKESKESKEELPISISKEKWYKIIFNNIINFFKRRKN